MKFAETLKNGLSTSYFGRLDRTVFDACAAAGIQSVELSHTYGHYMNELDFPRTAASFGRAARDAGVEVWSLHLPFSGLLDISSPDEAYRQVTMYTHRTLIRAAAEAGARVAVLHPSAEPIADDVRAEHLARSREGIAQLALDAAACGVALAVENLPRTCLCRRSGEMAGLLRGTGAYAVFDTNHALDEDNIHFIDALTENGVRIASLHISDYGPDAAGVLNERHRLPGDGINRWNELLAALERHGYTGPLMYENSRIPRDRSSAILLPNIAANMRALAAGEL